MYGQRLVRLDLRLGVAILLQLLFLEVTTSARAQFSNIDLLLKVNEAVWAVNDVISYSDWASTAGAQLRLEYSLSPPSATPHVTPSPLGLWNDDEFNRRLDKNTALVQNLPVPSLDSPLPTVGQVPSDSWDSMRKELQSRVTTWIEAALDIRTAKAGEELFNTLIKYTVVQENQLRRTQDVLGEVFDTRIPLPPVWLTSIGLEFLAFQGYISKNQALQSLEQSKRDALTQAIRSRVNVLQASAGELQIALDVEHAALSAEAQRLADVEARLAQKLRDLSAAFDIISRARVRVHAFELDLQQSKADLAEAISTLQNLADQRAQANRQIIDVNNQLGRTYDLCPNHETYDDCDHEDLKQQWRNRTANLNSQRTRLLLKINSLTQQQTDANTTKVKAQNDIDSYQSQLQPLRQQLATKESEYNTALTAYRSDRSAADQDKWQSRADVYSAGNATDRSRMVSFLQVMLANQ